MTFVRENYTMIKEQYILKGINDLVDYLQLNMDCIKLYHFY